MNNELLHNVWAVAGLGALVGFVVAYLLIRLTSGNVKTQLKTQSELKQVKTEVEQQKAKIEEHFAESADLLKSMAQDYQRLYKHLAQSSVALLPEATAKGIFNQTELLEQQPDESAVSVSAATSEATQSETAASETAADESGQPKDYSKGSSGLLKAKQS